VTKQPAVITEDQALFFRARRSHLAGPGAADAREAARAIVGAQAQQIAPALLALAQRTQGRPTAEELGARLYGDARDLVHTWGQRGTLHVYDAETDWALFAALRPQLADAGRRGALPTDIELESARRRLDALGRPATRGDLLSNLPARLVRAAAEVVGAGDAARRLAAGRLFWVLALRGEACVTEKHGAEQGYALRALWFPSLAWPAKPVDATDAGAALARRYLRANAPASVQDVAHFFGARVSEAKRWVAKLEDAGELIAVACGERKGLVALDDDARELARKPPAGETGWPTRLLPLWDCHLMGHADKSWTVPVEPERKSVWRKAAMIPGTVLARGRVVATWSHAAKAKRVDVTVQPLSGWRKTKHAAAVKREASELARHLGRGEARVAIE